MAISTAGRRLATLIRLPQMRLIPTQRMRLEPTSDRFERGLWSHDRCDQMSQQRDQTLKDHEGTTAKIAPFPFETVKTRTITISRIALANKVEVSPVRPSWTAPTTAIAPIQMVKAVVIKASTKLVSPLVARLFL